MTLVVGITGGIGSGKSTVCGVFRLLGIPVFEADAVARQLMNTDTGIKEGLTGMFGHQIYTTDGRLNRQMLADELFSDDQTRKKVNELVHPVVRNEFYKFAGQNKAMTYVIYEAAILFEGGFHEKMDFSILVAAPEEQRLSRVMERNGITEQSVRERMKSQWPEEKKRELADLCLENDNRHMIIPEIIALDKKLKNDGTIW
ncbi:MAG: dephospho-CoA kinase [Mariniphaga sp.]